MRLTRTGISVCTRLGLHLIDAISNVGPAPILPIPSPAAERDDWLSLDGRWRFTFDDDGRYADPAQIDAWPLTINVPFPPDSRASGIGDTSFHKACCTTQFEVEPDGGRVILHFGAVDIHAKVG